MILLELCLSLTVAAVLVSMFIGRLNPLLTSLTRLSNQLKLLQAQRYMFNQLEYELSQNSLQLKLQEQGQKLSCQTLSSQRQLTYTKEYINQHNGLYLTVKTANGSSKNPLFLPGCDLKSWQLQALDAHHLLVVLELSCGSNTQKYQQVFTLLNGSVEYE